MSSLTAELMPTDTSSKRKARSANILKEPWNQRSTALRPGDQPWDNYMFDHFVTETNLEQALGPRTSRALGRNSGRASDRDRRLFSHRLGKRRAAPGAAVSNRRGARLQRSLRRGI